MDPRAINPAWSGAYVGAQLGGHFTDTHATGATGGPVGVNTDLGRDGFFGGAQFGYGRQFGRLYFGGEADAVFGQFVNGRVQSPVGGTLTSAYTAYRRFLGTAEGKAGFASGHWLLYGTGGLAAAHLEQGVRITGAGAASPLNATDSLAEFGYAVGGGAEYRVSQRFSAFAGSEYYRFQKETLNLAAVSDFFPGGAVILRNSGSMLRVGANYRF